MTADLLSCRTSRLSLARFFLVAVSGPLLLVLSRVLLYLQLPIDDSVFLSFCLFPLFRRRKLQERFLCSAVVVTSLLMRFLFRELLSLSLFLLLLLLHVAAAVAVACGLFAAPSSSSSSSCATGDWTASSSDCYSSSSLRRSCSRCITLRFAL